MLVAVSGSQGSGKTLLLEKIQEKGFPVVERKTSRSILNDWNVSLDEVNRDSELTVKFQDEILKRKIEDEKWAQLQNIVWFTERTCSDLFVYANLSIGKYNKYSDWLNDYYRRCLLYNQNYSLVFYLRGGLISLEHDGVRSSNQHYSRMVDLTMLDFTQQMIHPSRLSIIEVSDLQQRTDLVIQQSIRP